MEPKERSSGGDAQWTLGQLRDRVVQALAVGYEQPLSRRVRGIPDERTIRFYTTLGLLSKPGGWRGRTALYGQRHLMQLVAIKRLQGAGMSLTQAQERLCGLDPGGLAEIAQVPPTALADAPAPVPSPAAVPRRRDTAFWKLAAVSAADAVPEPTPGVPSVQGVCLTRSALLVLLGAPCLTPAAEERLRRASAPLLEEMVRLGLVDVRDR